VAAAKAPPSFADRKRPRRDPPARPLF